MEEYYSTNPDFKRYVDRYAIAYGITVEEALTHELVRLTYRYYLGESNDPG